MKYSFSLALLILLFLTGCKTQHVAYHSTASVPYFSEATTTHLEVIVGSDDFAGDRDFVVYHAVDNGADAYTLIAPSTDRARENNEFQRGRIHRAVPLSREHSDKLAAGLAETLRLWETSYSNQEGGFYEFMLAPEQDVRRVSENVVQWRAALRFTFSHTPDGPSAAMLLGDSPDSGLQYVIEFDDREQIEDFRSLVVEAGRRL